MNCFDFPWTDPQFYLVTLVAGLALTLILKPRRKRTGAKSCSSCPLAQSIAPETRDSNVRTSDKTSSP